MDSPVLVNSSVKSTKVSARAVLAALLVVGFERASSTASVNVENASGVIKGLNWSKSAGTMAPTVPQQTLLLTKRHEPSEFGV
jgi:hypothetical protein